MTGAAGRRLAAEFTGTGLLVPIVVGSGIAASRLTTDGALRLLVNSPLRTGIVMRRAGRGSPPGR